MDHIAPELLEQHSHTRRSSAASSQEEPVPPSLSCSSSSSSGPATAPSPGTDSMLDLVQADLDQLYFDRVHPICPVIHQRRYFARIETEPPSLARACLRSAMRTVAAAMSAQFRRLSTSLYVETSRVLKELDTLETTPPLEQIQALILIAHYELLRMDEARAVGTARRCFRLIQLCRLQDTDAYNAGFSGTNVLDFVAAEERRRTFWVAYCFDRLLSSRHEWPLTLQEEEAIWTRLPVAEDIFQSYQPPEIEMDFLHEAIATSGQKAMPPFAESIVLTTLYGRTMNLSRMALLSTLDMHQFWTRHQALASVIDKRAQFWAWALPSQAGVADAVVAFVHILSKAAVMYIGEVAQLATAEVYMNGTELPSLDPQRAGQAASELVQLFRVMAPVNCFKVHPFVPSMIAKGARYLSRYGSGQEVEELRQTLRDLQAVNNLAREVLRGMDS
ncbi:hypothetical protein BDV18DRAFT_142091 [Aspergillus unguis]